MVPLDASLQFSDEVQVTQDIKYSMEPPLVRCQIHNPIRVKVNFEICFASLDLPAFRGEVAHDCCITFRLTCHKVVEQCRTKTVRETLLCICSTTNCHRPLTEAAHADGGMEPCRLHIQPGGQGDHISEATGPFSRSLKRTPAAQSGSEKATDPDVLPIRERRDCKL
ncbi:hypothetical protein JOB18_046256 [Solea senegalensis]|uniref:Uncharacterized protein n=1 Tax=Solea senegalensis TaxID=28829 RepID=A0AAV6SXP2_SOLSE|nr:hypothetical protein JOB18_046256 [Solea senegalensis]